MNKTKQHEDKYIKIIKNAQKKANESLSILFKTGLQLIDFLRMLISFLGAISALMLLYFLYPTKSLIIIKPLWAILNFYGILFRVGVISIALIALILGMFTALRLIYTIINNKRKIK